MENRPVSIVNFERCYLGAFVLGLLNTALSWSTTRAAFAASPQAALLGGWFFPVMTLIGFAITLSLWFFIARKGSAVAKWIATVLVVLGVMGSVFTFLFRTYPQSLSGIISVATLVLQVIAIVMLFRPDTKKWFGEDSVVPA